MNRLTSRTCGVHFKHGRFCSNGWEYYGSGHKVKSGMEQRDAAVRTGAKGATTITFKEGRLTIPSASNNMAEDFPDAASQIVGLLKPDENDVIVIRSADSLEKAEYGTLAAAWTLLNDR